VSDFPLTALETLLTSSRPDATPVANSGATVRTFGEFKYAVAQLAYRVCEGDEQDWLIAYEDGWELAVALLAVLTAGRRPVFPANHQAGHLADIGQGVDGVIGHTIPGKKLLHISDSDAVDPNVAAAGFDLQSAEIVLHTSGSSGQPEAFLKPFSCLQAEVETLHATFAQLSHYTILATVPAYHIYGLLFRVLWPLAAGWTFDADMVRYPEEISPRLEGSDQCFLVSSPAFLKRSVEALDWASLVNLKGVYSSGGPLAPEVGAAYNGLLSDPLYEVYGSTETGGIGYRAVRDANVQTNWTPLEGVDLTLDEAGRLRVSSRHIEEGFFQTEDLADLSGDGSFFLKGRADRIVNIEERRISLSEIEVRLQSREDILEAKCVPLEGEKRLIVGAVIRPSEMGWRALREHGKTHMVQQLRQTLKDHISPVGAPKKWRFVTAFPQNAQGKTTYNDTQALFQPAAERPVAPRVLSEKVDGHIANIQLETNPEQVWFDGHFPITPILPGLAQITWAQEIASRVFDVSGLLERLEVVKFFEVVRPGVALNLKLEFQPEKSRVLFHYWTDPADHAKGRIVFKEKTRLGSEND
jgi:3-hydroxymyristoyl/3-hydroxydecanoyl-(acyl carrier protein) dehydratase